MIYFHKILPLIFSPLFFIISLIIFGLILNSKKISLTGVAILIFFSVPVVSDKLIAYLESDYELIKTSKVESANAIVVLSGMVKKIQTKNGLDYEWGEAVDRIFAGIDLFKLNKAPVLILTGGKLPWSIGVPEGEYLRDVAIDLGVLKKDILITKNVKNTDEEAKAVMKLLSSDNPKVILVTSAFHMPRAQLVFEAAGINVIPFPVDFRAHTDKITFMSFIPSAHSFASTSFFVREMIGRTFYNLKY
ncbi:YdcF family protein [Candidatus Pelagibacter sp.]|nr:YdcF family protein [Candidatus Pelagibacter sp.]